MRNRLASIYLTASAIALSGGAADAQRTGTRLGRDATAQDGVKAMEMMASCMISRRPAFATNWLRSLPGSAEERRIIKKEEPDLGICLDNNQLIFDGKRVTFTPGLLRQPVATALLNKLLEKSNGYSRPLADIEPWFVTQLAAVSPDQPLDRNALILQDFGHCVAVNEWSGTLEFLGSAIGSPAEARGLSKIKPKLGPCLSEDAKVKLSTKNLRVVLAEPVYHLITDRAVIAPVAGAR